jgi:Holliday junction resolvase RusA-like endonuclease
LRPIPGAYKLKLELVRPDKRYRDLDNMLKAVSDALTDSGVIMDDRMCEWIEARWVKDGDPCVVTLEAIDGKDND